jgi:phosphate transport system substrate-binding protein
MFNVHVVGSSSLHGADMLRRMHLNQRFPRRISRGFAVVLVAFGMVAASCGSDSDSSAAPETPSNDLAEETSSGVLRGSLMITGSSTVEPVTNLLAESFSEIHPNVAFSIAGPGSGDGHKAACAGEVPIWNSSRQIKDKEVECLEEKGIEFIEFRVGIDGISVITSAENDAIECLNFADLYSLVGTESTGFGKWSDANDLNAEVGGTGPFPDGQLEIFAPGEESGTFDSFIEIALEDLWEERAEAGKADANFAVRPDYNASANDNVIIDGIAGNKYSLGWVGFAFADEARDQVRLVEVDGGEGCVEPTPASIASAEFPIARFLYTYVDAAQADDPAVSGFIDYMLSEEGQRYVVEAGYVNLSDEDLAQARANWANKVTGRTF